MKPKWYAYRTGPIDTGWEHLSSVEETGASIAAAEVQSHVHNDDNGPTVMFDDFLAGFTEALEEARKVGWEGDYQSDLTEPRVWWIPSPDTSDFKFAYIWKQSNDGTTFVISPIPLPWLRGV